MALRKFHHNDRVIISLMAADRPVVSRCRDEGTGIVLDGLYEPAVDAWQYHIAVIDGRFDGHRNDTGELWVNESEMRLV